MSILRRLVTSPITTWKPIAIQAKKMNFLSENLYAKTDSKVRFHPKEEVQQIS